MPVSFEDVRRAALALPGTEEGTSYGTPAIRVKRKLLIRLKEDGESFVLRVDPEDREWMLRADPKTFFVTDHYVGWPLVLVRMKSLRKRELQKLVDRSWRTVAPPRLLAAAPAARGPRRK